MLADLQPLGTRPDADRLRRGRARQAAEVASTCARSARRPRRSTWTPRWRPHAPPHAPNVASCGRWATTGSSWATRPTAATYARLLGETRPAMCFTDPPYNVALGDHGGQQRGSKKRRIQNDAMPPEQWAAFVARLGAQPRRQRRRRDLRLHEHEGVGAASARRSPRRGGHWSDTIIWKKDRFVMGRADYQRQYEPIWFGWREGAKHHWCGDRDQGDVWEIARPSESDAHPTMKPLRAGREARSTTAASRATSCSISSSDRARTLIAAERTGRVCYGMELDAALWQRRVGALGVVQRARRRCAWAVRDRAGPARLARPRPQGATASASAASRSGCTRSCGA